MKMTMAEYLSHPAVGSSSLRTLIASTPAHYKHKLENPTPSTPDQEFGTAIHQAILEPKFFKQQMIVRPIFEGKTKKGELTTSMNCDEVREKATRWEMANHGKTIISQEQFEQVQGILNSISNHRQAVKLITNGASEESLFWKDPESGIPCKARLDWRREGHIIVDVKTTLNAAHWSFRKDAAKYGYHIQGAMHLDAATANFSLIHDTYIIIAVEKKAPFAVNCFQLKQSTIQEGRQSYYKALLTMKECLKTGFWPGYGDQLTPLELSSWALGEDL